MINKNRYYCRSGIGEAKFRQLVRCFALDFTATGTAGLIGILVRVVSEENMVEPAMIIYSNGWRGYDGLVGIGFDKYFRVIMVKMNLRMVSDTSTVLSISGVMQNAGQSNLMAYPGIRSIRI